ncbi:hypothetical protein MP213Fo_12770 [Pseudochrobactrum sp. MP213Fo]
MQFSVNDILIFRATAYTKLPVLDIATCGKIMMIKDNIRKFCTFK